MSLGCNLKEVKSGIEKETRQIFSDAIRENTNTYSYNFGPNNRFKTEEDVVKNIKLKQVKFETFIKTNLPGATSTGMISHYTDGNKVFVTIQNTKTFNDVLSKAFKEDVLNEYEKSSNESFQDELNKAFKEKEDLHNKMDSFYAPIEFENINDKIFEGTFDNHRDFLRNAIKQIRDKLNTTISEKYQVLEEIKKSKVENPDLKNQLNLLNKKENDLKIILNGNPIDALSDLGLIQQLEDLEKDPTISKLLHYTNSTFERIDSLLESGDIRDLNEANKLISYLEALGTFDYNVANPLFKNSEMFDDKGNIIINEDVKKALEKIKANAIVDRLRLSSKERTLLEDNLNSLNNVSTFYKGEKLNYDQFFSKENGLKDTAIVDMFIMDVTNGIFSHNGIIPQAMQSILHQSYDSALVNAKNIEEQVDRLTPEVNKILSELGYSYGAFGIKGVKYEEVFRAKDESGAFRDGYISRFSQKFYDNLSFRRSEFKNSLNSARKLYDEDKKKAARLEQKAYNDFKDWIKTNTEVVDISKLPELEGEFQGVKGDANYKNQLINLLGNGDARVGLIAYNEMIEEQLENIRSFENLKEQNISNIISKEGVSNFSEISPESLASFKRWEASHNPINFSNKIHRNTDVVLSAGTSGVVNNLNPKFNVLLPKRKINETYDHNINTGDFKTREIDSNYYDKRFEVIEKEGNEALKEFHNLLLKTTGLVYNALDYDNKKDFGRDNLLYLEKSIIEVLTDENMTFLARVSTAAKMLYEKLISIITEKINSQYRNEMIDVTTGLPTDKVSSDFFNSTKGKVNEQYVLLSEMTQDIFGTSSRKFNVFRKKNDLPKKYIEMIDGLVGSELRQKMISSYDGDSIPIFKVLKTALEHKTISEQSFDLPKIMKYFSFSAMEYQARTEALPNLNIIKEHYKNIKKPATTSQGYSIINVNSDDRDNDSIRKDGLRTNANKQMDSWFNRAVLGNYNTKNEFGDTSGLFNTIDGTGKLDSLVNKRLRLAAGKKFYTKKEQELFNNYEILLKKKEAEIEQMKAQEEFDEEKFSKLNKEYSSMLSKQNNLGGKITLKSLLDGILDFIRLRGLGWNISSQTTNFLEGQIANTIMAASGKYFTSENIYRANSIIQGSMLKNGSFGHLSTEGAKKARVLMDRFRVLQDTSNELQKSSTKSSYSKAAEFFDPYNMMKRVEYLNQTPLMIATMLDVKVKDSEGNETNLWDALDENGDFIGNYGTEENIKNWVDVNGEKFFQYSQFLGKAIIDTHGDYHQLRGNMASEYVSGKAILMFKRWFARQVYSRFGVEQADIETNQILKGRYRSLTLPTAVTTGAAVGFTGLALIGAGPLGMLAGGVTGLVYGTFTGKKSGLGLLEEMSFVMKEAFLNILRVPINSLTGKQIIKSADFSKFNKMEEIDLKNFRANIMELSLLLSLNAMTLFMKGLLWDDDDEEDSLRRRSHNLIINKLMSLSGQATTYLNPVEMKDMFSDITLLKFFDEVREVAVAGQKALNGEDILMSGPNAGGSRLAGQLSKTFFPSPLKSGFGFGTQMDRQFEPSVIDSWFHGEEKEAQTKLKRIKAKAKESYKYNDLSEEEQKELDSILGRLFNKDSGGSYIDKLDEVEDYLEDNSIDDFIMENQ